MKKIMILAIVILSITMIGCGKIGPGGTSSTTSTMETTTTTILDNTTSTTSSTTTTTEGTTTSSTTTTTINQENCYEDYESKKTINILGEEYQYSVGSLRTIGYPSYDYKVFGVSPWLDIPFRVGDKIFETRSYGLISNGVYKHPSSVSKIRVYQDKEGCILPENVVDEYVSVSCGNEGFGKDCLVFDESSSVSIHITAYTGLEKKVDDISIRVDSGDELNFQTGQLWAEKFYESDHITIPKESISLGKHEMTIYLHMADGTIKEETRTIEVFPDGYYAISVYDYKNNVVVLDYEDGEVSLRLGSNPTPYTLEEGECTDIPDTDDEICFIEERYPYMIFKNTALFDRPQEVPADPSCIEEIELNIGDEYEFIRNEYELVEIFDNPKMVVLSNDGDNNYKNIIPLPYDTDRVTYDSRVKSVSGNFIVMERIDMRCEG